MKKKFLCSTLAMAMTASMLFGCASESKTETTAAAGETTAAAAETTAEAAKAETNGEKLKVTLLVTGSFGDKAFNDSAQAGMEKLEAELGDKVEVNMVEMGSDKTKFEGSMLDACESDADLIITGLWDMKEITEKVAQEFPEKKFIIFDTDVDYTLGDLSNVYSMSYKQNDAERMIQRAEGNKTGTSTVTPEGRYLALCTIYNFYSPNMCQRFGTARVMAAYGYSDQVTDITATRHRKIVFCEMLLDEQPFTSRLFGMELGRMAFDGEIYDVENDFHGICFLYGWVGLAMMVAFIGYFLYLIVKCLIKDFRKYFTVEAGAFGIGMCLCLGYAYFTAGVLRSPNASIYMSVLLAVVYYLTQMRSEQPDALPDGEEKRA